MRLAMDTIDELEWCLEQLETVQTHRSVSDMASLKVTSQAREKLIKNFLHVPLFVLTNTHTQNNISLCSSSHRFSSRFLGLIQSTIWANSLISIN